MALYICVAKIQLKGCRRLKRCRYKHSRGAIHIHAGIQGDWHTPRYRQYQIETTKPHPRGDTKMLSTPPYPTELHAVASLSLSYERLVHERMIKVVSHVDNIATLTACRLVQVR